MTIVAKARGYVATLTREGRDYDVQITRGGAVVVAGMYGAGMLDLSEYSPDGTRVTLSASVVEALEEAIGEAIADGEDDEDEDDHHGDRCAITCALSDGHAGPCRDERDAGRIDGEDDARDCG